MASYDDLDSLIVALKIARISAWMKSEGWIGHASYGWFRLRVAGTTGYQEEVTGTDSNGEGGGKYSISNVDEDHIHDYIDAFNDIRSAVDEHLSPWRTLPDPEVIQKWIEPMRLAISEIAISAVDKDGGPTGGGEVVHYVARAEPGRVAIDLALVDARPPDVSAADSLLALEARDGAKELLLSESLGRLPAWSLIDGGGAPGINKNSTFTAHDPQVADSFHPPRLATANGQLYATWVESTGASGVASSTAQVRVKVYDGTGTTLAAWSASDGDSATVGLNKNVGGAKSASWPGLAALGSKVYAVWSETNGTTPQIRAALAGCP